MPSPSNRIGDDRLREILAGCEGVTPGPWALSAFDVHRVIAIHDGPDHAGREYIDGRHQHGICEMDPGTDSVEFVGRRAHAAYIARLDPQTVASIVSELLSHRERLAYRHGELVEAVSRPTKEPAHGK